MSERARTGFPCPAAIAAIAAFVIAARGAAADDSFAVRAEISPPVAQLGERVTYRGWILVPHGTPVRWVIPRTGGDLSWGRPSAERVAGPLGLDTVRIAAPLQVFTFGEVNVPGLRLLLPPATNERGLPVARMIVMAQIAPHDTSSQLRPVRGPVPAPWWERVPWILTSIVAAAIVALIALILWLRRRRPRAVAPPRVAPAPAPRRDPSAEALAALATLRRLELPEKGRFGEHAFQLTRIVRRFLEATAGGIRPGDTTSELVAMLSAGAPMLDVARLEGLLRLWDFIKFARGSTTAAEAHQAEDAVEAMLRSAAAARREVA